jgi:hypothetical protein
MIRNAQILSLILTFVGTALMIRAYRMPGATPYMKRLGTSGMVIMLALVVNTIPHLLFPTATGVTGVATGVSFGLTVIAFVLLARLGRPA